MSSLRRGHANLLCIVPILADDLFRGSDRAQSAATRAAPRFPLRRLCVCAMFYYIISVLKKYFRRPVFFFFFFQNPTPLHGKLPHSGTTQAGTTKFQRQVPQAPEHVWAKFGLHSTRGSPGMAEKLKAIFHAPQQPRLGKKEKRRAL